MNTILRVEVSGDAIANGIAYIPSNRVIYMCALPSGGTTIVLEGDVTLVTDAACDTLVEAAWPCGGSSPVGFLAHRIEDTSEDEEEEDE